MEIYSTMTIMDDMSREDKIFVFSYFYPYFECLASKGGILSTVMNKNSMHIKD